MQKTRTSVFETYAMGIKASERTSIEADVLAALT
jgi:hypothetical protein